MTPEEEKQVEQRVRHEIARMLYHEAKEWLEFPEADEGAGSPHALAVSYAYGMVGNVVAGILMGYDETSYAAWKASNAGWKKARLEQRHEES